jgi:hypothetical protein
MGNAYKGDVPGYSLISARPIRVQGGKLHTSPASAASEPSRGATPIHFALLSLVWGDPWLFHHLPVAGRGGKIHRVDMRKCMKQSTWVYSEHMEGSVGGSHDVMEGRTEQTCREGQEGSRVRKGGRNEQASC